MKRNFYLIIGIVLSIVLCVISCKKEKINADNSTPTENQEPQGDGIIQNAVTDYDGNKYDAIRLGNQVWMASNLRTTHYADGDAIDEGTATNYHHAYYYKPNGVPTSYGYFYNKKAAVRDSESSESNPSGVQGVCPNGWHVPSNAEWEQLLNYCASKAEYTCNGSTTGKAMASVEGWNASIYECAPGYEPSSNNASGFNATPTGYFSGVENNFTPLGIICNFWGATGCDYCTYAYSYGMTYNGKSLSRSERENNEGLSVRCVKD